MAYTRRIYEGRKLVSFLAKETDHQKLREWSATHGISITQILRDAESELTKDGCKKLNVLYGKAGE